MKPITIQEIRAATGGKPMTAVPATVGPILSVSNDTRMMEPGSLFIALRDRRDGHDFLPDAAARGAMAALVERAPDAPQPNVHLIQVPDARVAMGKVARYVRQQMSRCKVIGVAGSNGKTSTKHLIDAALRSRLKGSISPKSFNNDIGVPLTIFAADPSQDYLVLEMGTNHHGEIKVLTEMATPDVAVITNCGPEHLEFLGDVMGVRRENASVIEGLNPGGALVVNGDDPHLLDAVAGYKGKRITFGYEHHNDLFADEIECTSEGTSFRLNKRAGRVFVPQLGKHAAVNALAAIAVARFMRVPESDVLESLAHADGPEMRLQLQRISGLTILNDAYNANPASMTAALDTVSAIPHSGRRIAVLGDMLELGPSSARYHREIGQHAARLGNLKRIVCVGPQSLLIAEGAEQAGFAPDCIDHFPSSIDASRHLPNMLQDNDLILLKASRGVRLEEVAKVLAMRAGAPASIKIAS